MRSEICFERRTTLVEEGVREGDGVDTFPLVVLGNRWINEERHRTLRSPGSSNCSVKQKHSILLKYSPI